MPSMRQRRRIEYSKPRKTTLVLRFTQEEINALGLGPNPRQDKIQRRLTYVLQHLVSQKGRPVLQELVDSLTRENSQQTS